MFKERYGVKLGQVVSIRTYSDDGHLRKKEDYTVEKLYPSVVLLRKENGVKLCPGYPQLRWMTMDKKSRTLAERPVRQRLSAHLPKDEKYPHLSQKQVTFCKWYLKIGDASKAMAIAGYGCTETGDVIRILKNKNIQECLEKMKKEMGK